MSPPFLIGVDVGTTSVKAALFDAAGQTLKTYASAYPTARPLPGWAEQEPADWTSRVCAAIGQLVDGLPSGAVAGLGLCSQVNTHVFVDEKGEPLLPAIIWQDGRCALEAAELDRLVAAKDRLEWWGAPLPIDASHVLSRMAFVARAHPEIWRKTRWVMAPKDYCLFKLTGEVAADPMASFGVIDQSLAYIPSLIDLVPGAFERLPPLQGITARLGGVRNGLPGAGLAVVNSTMDAWAGMLGAGAARQGDAAYLSGTSEVGGIVSARRIPTPGVITFPSCEGITLHAAPTQAGGASVAWLAAILGRSADEISALAAKSALAQAAPIFLPHLQGERAPLWDINARASFSGLDGTMGAPEMARAVLEGVAYSVRLLMEALEKSSGVKPERLHHAGGGAGSDVWCQIRADVLGRVIERKANRDAGVVGAAILAGIGTGVFGSISEAARHLARTEREYTPNPARRAMYAEGFARYVELYGRLKGFCTGG
ncbi:MAG TPA: FGGY-family carbohydrate kinase [Roseiarcus sp.]|nr:FGGY-family carbohydrate kinase [Roseiarcus sp.]